MLQWQYTPALDSQSEQISELPYTIHKAKHREKDEQQLIHCRVIPILNSCLSNGIAKHNTTHPNIPWMWVNFGPHIRDMHLVCSYWLFYFPFVTVVCVFFFSSRKLFPFSLSSHPSTPCDSHLLFHTLFIAHRAWSHPWKQSELREIDRENKSIHLFTNSASPMAVDWNVFVRMLQKSDEEIMCSRLSHLCILIVTFMC